MVDFRLASRAALNVACAHRAELWPFPLCCISVVARCCVSTRSALQSIKQRLIYCLFLLEVDFFVGGSFVLVCVTLSRANYSRSHTAFQLKIRTQPGQGNKETLNTINQFLLLLSFSPLTQTLVALAHNPVIVTSIPPQPPTTEADHINTTAYSNSQAPNSSFSTILPVGTNFTTGIISLVFCKHFSCTPCVCVCVCVSM